MRVIRGKKGDVKEILLCRRKSLEYVNASFYSGSEVRELLTFHTEEIVLDEIDNFDFYCLKKKGHIVGVVYFKKNRIEGLYVHPAFVGRGYGAKLLKFAEKKIKKSGCATTTVYSSLVTQKFYESVGYRAMDVALSLTKKSVKFVYMVKNF